jgi:mRNA interferase YafQ
MLEIKRHRLFKKDIPKIRFSDSQYNKYIKYLSLLASNDNLPKEALNHSLKGNWSGFQEFHLGGDMVVIYRFTDDEIELVRIGSHNQVFK